MRIVSFAVAFMLCISLISCSKKPSQQEITSDLTRGFVCTANISFGDIVAKADINRQAPGLCKISLLEPKNLEGMAFEYEGDNVALSYKGLKLAFNSESLPAKAMTQLLVKTLDAATRTQGMNFKLENDVLIVTGKNDSGDFSLKLDKNNGNLLSLSMPSMNLDVQFSDFSFLT